MAARLSPFQRFLLTWLLILVTGWVTVNTLDYVSGLIGLLLTAALIAFLFNYAVAGLQRLSLPRRIAIPLAYLAAIVVTTLVGFTVVPPAIDQGRQLVARLPALLDDLQRQLAAAQAWAEANDLPVDFKPIADRAIERLQNQFQNIASTGFGVVLGTFNWVIEAILIVVVSFYMLPDSARLWRGITLFLAPPIQQELTRALQQNLQRFVTGQLLLGSFMAVTLTLAFRVLDVPFFLLFALFVGALELIPFIGATIGIGTVTLLVAFIDGWLALQVLAVSVVVQQFKDNLVSPRVMGNLTGLSPVVILVALLLGARIGGLLGVILAIPVTGALKSLTDVIADPALPPQTGAFFNNPLQPKPSAAALSPSEPSQPASGGS